MYEFSIVLYDIYVLVLFLVQNKTKKIKNHRRYPFK